MWTTVFSISEQKQKQKQKRKPTRTRQNPPTDLATKCKSSVKTLSDRSCRGTIHRAPDWDVSLDSSRFNLCPGLNFQCYDFFLAEESTSHGPENRTLGLRLVLERGRCLIVVSVHSSSIRKIIILIYLKIKKKNSRSSDQADTCGTSSSHYVVL